MRGQADVDHVHIGMFDHILRRVIELCAVSIGKLLCKFGADVRHRRDLHAQLRQRAVARRVHIAHKAASGKTDSNHYSSPPKILAIEAAVL